MASNIGPVSSELRDLWLAEGVSLTDTVNECEEPHDIHLLLGADVASQLLLEKRTIRGSVAWKTELGWVLSGPQTITQSQHDGNPVEAVVSYVSAHGSSLDEQVANSLRAGVPNCDRRQSWSSFSPGCIERQL